MYIQLTEQQAAALEESSLREGLTLVDSRPGEAQEPEVPGEGETGEPGTGSEENGESSQPPESSEAEEESSLPEGDSQEGEVSQTEETESQGPETTPGAAAPEPAPQETVSSGMGVLAQPLKAFVGLFAGTGAGEGQEAISGKFLHFTVAGSSQVSFEKTLCFTLPQGVDSLSLDVEREDMYVYDGEGASLSFQLSTTPVTLKRVQAEYTPGEAAAQTQVVTWVDNNDEAGLRPAYGWGEGQFHPEVTFSVKTQGGQVVKSGVLNDQTLKELGLEQWPAITGTSEYFSISLPETLQGPVDSYGNQQQYTVTWSFKAPEVDGYRLEETDSGWTYTRVEDFTFTLAMRRGGAFEELTREKAEKLLGQFSLQGQTNRTQEDSVPLESQAFAELEWTMAAGSNDSYMITIPNLPCYNEKGDPLTYWVAETDQDGEGAGEVTFEELESDTSLLPEGEEGDSFAISYDNAGVDDAGSSVTQTYSGGQLALTLTGTTDYQATKIWLDNGDASGRPQAEFALWRYIVGSQPNQASQVRLSDVVEGGDNTFVEMTLSTSEQAQEGEAEIITIEFTDQEGQALALPKYNPDGARYLYGAREYLTGGSHYEQVFGQVGEDGSVTGDKVPAYKEGQLVDGVRQDGDDLVYTGGILSNRRTNTATAQVTKIWQAAAYQADFEDVAVEFTLYQQAKEEEEFTPSDSAQPVEGEDRKPVTYVLHDFSAEHLTDSGAVSGLPLYDAQGQELEYFWKETAVYQGVDVPTTASQEMVKAALEDATKHPVTDSQFTLTQAQALGEEETEVAYHAEVEYKRGSTVVTNKIQDQVEFAIKKYWKDGNGETVDLKDDVTFHIYQTLAGNDFDFNTPYVTVTIPKDESEKPYLAKTAPEGVSLTSESGDIDRFNERNEPSNTEWDCIVQNLPKFDETGHLYSYFLLEAEDEHGQGYVPSYVNDYYPESGDYSSVITNAPGDPTVIMVQKNWIDDGDALHRGPVKVGVYYSENGTLQPLEKDGEPVTKTMDGSSGSWTEFISFDLPENVALTDLYVVELEVGGSAVDHGHSEEESDLPTVEEWKAGHAIVDENENKIFSVSTDHHRYQVTYETQVKPNAAVPANVDALYTVTNRRLGAIDVKVNKTWLSGGQGEGENQGIAQLVEAMQAASEGGTQYALAFQLDFANGQEGWEITNNGGNDTVTVDSEAVPITGEDGVTGAASLQVILGPEDDQPVSEFSFYSLPKYDEAGAVVSYQVREVWVTKSADGTAWTTIENNQLPKELQEVWGQYTASYQTQNVVGTDGETEPSDAPLRDRDTQTVSVTNRRGDVKDVTWYKEWRDHFADGNGNRPDLYLDIYSVVHDESGSEQIQLVKKDYRWKVVEPGQSQTDRETVEVPATQGVLASAGLSMLGETTDSVAVELPVTETSNQENDLWSVTIEGVPQYDDYGYEIQYFAVERTKVHVSDFDYQAVQYAAENPDGPDTVIFGNRDGVGFKENQENVLDLEAGTWKNPDDMPGDIGEYDTEDSTAIKYPQYALLEDGTFINTLANSFSVTGVKLWAGLPAGYLNSPQAQLPGVRFDVYRSTQNTEEAFALLESTNAVASLTIRPEDWEKIQDGTAYRFHIDYMGENTVAVGEDGEALFQGEEGAEKLPLYDENGNRYYYRVRETMNLGDELATDQVYQIQTDMSSNFTFTNTYAPETGKLQVKKILTIPAGTTADNGGFPAVQFTLTRSYQVGENWVEETGFAVTKTIDSGTVQAAFEAAKGEGSEGPVTFELGLVAFDNLPLYAPNGSKYLYTVEETGGLGGYLTYAAQGDVAVGTLYDMAEGTSVAGLVPHQDENDGEGEEQAGADATFYNKRQDTQETVTLTGTKTWQDYNDAMGTRPSLEEGEDPLHLTVSRTTDGKTETLSPELYTVAYTDEGNTWTFTIEGTEGSGELERYATNGKAWTYTVREDMDQCPGYSATSGGAWSSNGKTPGEDGMVALSSVTNSLYMTVPFEKVWKDENGNAITTGYIDLDVTVTFQLQVSDETGSWEDAGTYFGEHLAESEQAAIASAVTGGDTDSPFTKTVTGKIYNTGWSGSFANLPRVIKSGDTTRTLQYRVVETQVSYNGTTQTLTLEDGTTYTVEAGNLVTGAEFSSTGNVTTNTLAAISLTVEKAWEDGDNQYGTRPNSRGESATWEAWFVLQRQTDGGGTWENVQLINLYGGDEKDSAGKWSETIVGLPTVDFTGQGACTYRVRELKPKLNGGQITGYTDLNSVTDDDLVEPGDTYAQTGNFDYKAEYSTENGIVNGGDQVTVTNTLYMDADRYQARKVWYNEEGDKEAPADASVTVVLQYKAGEKEWKDYQTATLNEENNWTYTWEDLPSQMEGEKNVAYRVEERSHTPEDYLLIDATVTEETEGDTTTGVYTFTNVAPSALHVEKTWLGGDVPEGATVKVGLYRTTDASTVGSLEGEAMDTTQTLTADNGWQADFTSLPKYDKDGTPYHYYALELEGTAPVGENGSLACGGQQYHVTYNTENGATHIANTLATSLSGEKVWLDNGNAYGSRPDPQNFTLTLERSITGTDWEQVDLEASGIAFAWTESGTGTWTYTFSNLPVCDGEGAPYTYRVTEPELNGYVELHGGKGETAEGKGPTFTNLLTDEIDISGSKSWEDGGSDARPETIQLTLERKAEGEEAWTTVGAAPTWEQTDTDLWTYHYTGLARFDGQGVAYTYRVRELSVEGYDVYYQKGDAAGVAVEGQNLTNVAQGKLTVEKRVTGNWGSYSREFPFSVTFTLPAGYAAGNELPVISFEKSDGTVGTVTFEEGQDTATCTFQLSHGQSITFEGLPGHTAYQVTETDTCGHRLTATGDKGAILPGGENQAEFVNHRSGSYPDGPDPDEPDPDDPEDPDIDIPDDPTPGGDVDPDDPDDPENPEEPDDPDVDIPDDPTPGGDVDPDDPKDPDKDDPSSGSGEKDDKPKLPQTGQLWWPVLPLGAAGAGLLAVGAARRKVYHGKHF